ncbi:MAG: class I SAM-dependent methyltransferase [Chloroflexi bacterium]|nr:class I SAM-dependent methyltransferase [Chloroflexota bacterium]
MSHEQPLDDLSPLERRWRELVPPEEVDSARALYEGAPLWSNRQLPFVDVPYDAAREQHWADAARVADYASHLPPGGRVVVDIGPGDGWPAVPLAARLPTATVIGIDPAPRRTAVCRANAERLALSNATFITGDASALPLRDASVDLVTASQSLEESSDPARVFEEIARVLRPGGVLRASFQVWRLPTPAFETVALTAGRDGLLYSYSRRTQAPARERRSVLVVPSDGPAAAIHREALIASADAPRAYGETLLEPGRPSAYRCWNGSRRTRCVRCGSHCTAGPRRGWSRRWRRRGSRRCAPRCIRATSRGASHARSSPAARRPHSPHTSRRSRAPSASRRPASRANRWWRRCAEAREVWTGAARLLTCTRVAHTAADGEG